MIALDTATDERLDSHQILAGRIVAEIQAELLDNIHEPATAPKSSCRSRSTPRPNDARSGRLECFDQPQMDFDHLLQAHGWDFERAVFVKDMAKLKKEPPSSLMASTAY